MNPLHLVVDIAGAFVVICAGALVFGFLTLVGLALWNTRKQVKVLTEEGVREEIARLNERQRMVVIAADNEREAVRKLIGEVVA